jgi:hypothetical protein
MLWMLLNTAIARVRLLAVSGMRDAVEISSQRSSLSFGDIVQYASTLMCPAVLPGDARIDDLQGAHQPGHPSVTINFIPFPSSSRS